MCNKCQFLLLFWVLKVQKNTLTEELMEGDGAICFGAAFVFVTPVYADSITIATLCNFAKF